jgi:glucan phosphoethanolaminetransferase (alkaline phosphatase superfamily)
MKLKFCFSRGFFKIGTISYIVILSIFITSLNFKTFYLKMGSSVDLLAQYMTQLCFNILLLLMLSFSQKALRVFSIIWIFLGFIGFYCLNEYGTIVDESILFSISDNIDSIDVVSMYKISLYISAFCVISFALWRVKIIKAIFSKKIIMFFVCVSVISAYYFSHKDFARRNYFSSYGPFNLCASIGQYLIKSSLIRKNVEKIDITKIYKSHDNSEENLNIILIIGESARSDHFGINGYARNTTPLIRRVKNIVSFLDVTPCSNNTRVSLSCLLSHKTREEFSIPIQDTNITSVFNQLGYNTSWYSTQSVYGQANIILQSSSHSKTKRFRSYYRSQVQEYGPNRGLLLDEIVLPDLRRSLKNYKKNFVVLHTNGSHAPHEIYVPPSFFKFSPYCFTVDHKSCTNNGVVNMYDNSLLYTDYFISEVIKSASSTPSIVLYVSDHGAFLGENGKYFHGNTGDFREQAHRVPMTLWMSDSLIQRNIYRTKLENSKVHIKEKLSHDNVFHSLLDCANVKSEMLHEKLSVCARW